MSKEFPKEFLERLQVIIPSDQYDQAVKTFSQSAPIVVRLNTLVETHGHASLQGIRVLPEAFICDEKMLQQLKDDGVFDSGSYYRQSLSSMLVVEVLDPQPGEKILDLCAAPGSKTSQMAARMNNSGEIVAVEAIRNRFYKLRSVLQLLGVENTTCLCMDGRRFRARDEPFDRVLVDAPCSSEGRFKMNEPKTYAYWSLRKIKEMVKKQRGLLLNASRQLKSGGVLVYSTCTFAPEENEGVIDWFLGKVQGQFEVESVFLDYLETYPAIMHWGRKHHGDQIKNCVRILPKGLAEGFFIVKMRKME